MSDHPTTGGYPVIACVATVDLPILGQLRPGDLLRFERITQPEALEALRERERLFFAWSATP
jgi:antagonist of KipI